MNGTSTPTVTFNPVRLCCLQRHEPGSVICPDGQVMCCLCYQRFPLEDLATDRDSGRLTDACKGCAEAEANQLTT